MRKRFGFEKWPVFCQKKGAVFLWLHEICGCTKNLNVLNVVQNKFLRWYKNLCLQLWCHITRPKFEHSKERPQLSLAALRQDGRGGTAVPAGRTRPERERAVRAAVAGGGAECAARRDDGISRGRGRARSQSTGGQRAARRASARKASWWGARRRHGRGARRRAREPGKQQPRAATLCRPYRAELPPRIGSRLAGQSAPLLFQGRCGSTRRRGSGVVA